MRIATTENKERGGRGGVRGQGTIEDGQLCEQ